MLISLYILSVIVSYFMFRMLYKMQGELAKYNPHLVAFIYMFIPVINIPFVLILILIELTRGSKINYKWFFRLK